MSFNSWGDAILHSLYGRKLGLTKDNYVAGPAGYIEGMETISTAASVLAPTGISNLQTTAASSLLTIAGPSLALRGLTKIINNISTGGYTCTVTLSAGYFQTPASSTYSVITSTGMGQSLTLQYLTSALAIVNGNQGTMTFA